MQYVIQKGIRLEEYLVTEINRPMLVMLKSMLDKEYHWLDVDSPGLLKQTPKLESLINGVLSDDEKALQELMTIAPEDCLLIDWKIAQEAICSLEELQKNGLELDNAIRATNRLTSALAFAKQTTTVYLSRIRGCFTTVLQDAKEIEKFAKKDSELKI